MTHVTQMLKCLTILAFLGGWLFVPMSQVQAKGSYTKKEKMLAKPPKRRFYDRRLKRVYRHLTRQYKHIYSHVSADGYIFPNEERELKFNLRILYRVITIDKRNKKVLKIYRRLNRKQRRLNRKNRWRRRRRLKLLTLSDDDRVLYKKAKYHKVRYEKMIRRFACRYIPRYPKRYKRHCKKRR